MILIRTWMPDVATYEMSPRFQKDYESLSRSDRSRARRAAKELADDLNNHRAPRPGLRVKRVQTAPPGVLEMTWAPNGRATFEFGREVRVGHRHIVWRRIGTHAVFDAP
jgi:hypothetical protein